MARKVRVQYPGAIYHILSRGDRREPIFQDDEDRRRFLESLGEVCTRTGWRVHAYVLMPNHFHLVAETPEPNLVAGMKWFLGTYTSRFNRRHGLCGHLFAGRYKALVVEGSGNGYLKAVCDYVHLNPARSTLLPASAPLRSFRWSSWPAYLAAAVDRPEWLCVDRLLGECRIPTDGEAGRRRLERLLEGRRMEEAPRHDAAIRNGWYVGDESFRRELLSRMADRLGGEHFGAERRETVLDKAERIIAESLRAAGVSEAELKQRAKGDPAKVDIALRLRSETVLSVGWIAHRLHMGSRAYANHLLWRARKATSAAAAHPVVTAR